ncbi:MULTISPECIES: metallophosphoesterase family protein [Hydrogenophaga]|uniref:Ser/Thr protein phosphatase family protein n=1 Tax=Hydrogenophaga intermedia TaxID=65786 RepID=A0A1L1PDC9_HYDIT|nr:MULTISPECIES: metallophosphoesterase [Hydrogenophaga]AOS78116.1 serine/threonine protein phosphatase [Hydrogenophaga sp. PBC]TMU76300.1 metallophosphoesterase [Hydrogenophaga intermedia]CDN88022.1 Ser/Thr protein phosphatase family protein [Hydrogenophaga intermedia]
MFANNNPRLRISAIALATSLMLAACGGGGGDGAANGGNPPTTPPASQTPATLRIGVLPDTQGSSSGVAQHPMKAVLDFHVQQGVKIVLAVGDLVENGTPEEYALWREVADQYKDKLTILPVMGNHEPKGTDQDWHDAVESFIPADAEHMPGARNKNYALVRDNVLLINISYGWFERSYEFVEAMVNKHTAKVDHIILQTHNSFAGSRYGLVRENIIDGSISIENDVLFRDVYDKYRKLLAAHDVIYVSGHEHHYSRSLIRDNTERPFVQIISGNAAYKGYETRFSEHERIQDYLMMKVQNEGTGFVDVNASVFEVTGPRIDYRSYFITHSVFANTDPLRELATPNWTLMDRFVRTKDRCAKTVYPSSVPSDVQRFGVYDPSYRTSTCVSAGGSRARLLDGVNNTFNRHDSRTRTMSATPGYSFANSNVEMESMMYRYIFQRHQSYSPNLNNSQRARIVNVGAPDEEVEVRGTTIDLKKQVLLNWQAKGTATLSDELIISGINGQDGTYIDPYGAVKDIAADTGLPGSYGNGTELGKAPVVLPAHANKGWALADDKVGDSYVVEFMAPTGRNASNSAIARHDTTTKAWVPLASAACVSAMAYQTNYLTAQPADVNAACGNTTVVGFNANNGAFWARLNRDERLAIVAR